MYKRMRLLLIMLAAVIIVAIVLVLVLREKPSETPPVTASPTAEIASPVMTMPVPQQDNDNNSGAASIVNAYFDAWMAKDTNAMDALLIDWDRGTSDYSELQYEESVTLTAIAERPAEEALSRFKAEWYDGTTPSDVALVMVDYNIAYNDAGKELYLRDGLERKDYQFWLAKPNATSDWKIVMQGY